MELAASSPGELIFSTMYPHIFASSQSIVKRSDRSIVISCTPTEVSDIRSLEAKVLRDLRKCSKHLIAGFRDELAAMFESSVDADYPGRVKFNLAQPSPDCSSDQDLALSPVLVTMRPGHIFVTWTASLLDYEVCPGDMSLDTCLAESVCKRSRRVRNLLSEMEARALANAKNIKPLDALLTQHGFP